MMMSILVPAGAVIVHVGNVIIIVHDSQRPHGPAIHAVDLDSCGAGPEQALQHVSFARDQDPRPAVIPGGHTVTH